RRTRAPSLRPAPCFLRSRGRLAPADQIADGSSQHSSRHDSNDPWGVDDPKSPGSGGRSPLLSLTYLNAKWDRLPGSALEARVGARRQSLIILQVNTREALPFRVLDRDNTYVSCIHLRGRR